MKALDLIDFPLDGLSLIEASAGTGKTYALANLYLRYLLEKQFTVDQILVVTFTEAATQELKDRIRCRIKELGELFDQDRDQEWRQENTVNNDAVLNQLLKASIERKTREADRLRLKLAERQIDQAEIHTIHGFCQQLLRSHALDAKSPLKQTLLEDPQPLLKQVIEDFWRQQVLSLTRDELSYISANWASPDELLRSIRPLLNRSPALLIPSYIEGGLTAWSQSYQEAVSWFSCLKVKTQACIDELEELIAKSDLKRLKDKQNWLHKISVWSAQEDIDFAFPSAGKRSNLFNDFLPENLLAQTKSKGAAPQHPFFDFLVRHLASEPPSLHAQFIVQSYRQVYEMLDLEKQNQRVLGFDDLILNVSNALKVENKAFAETVQARYQVALIDEFQDTDQAQYHIFSTLFGTAREVNVGDPSDVARLVLIGDPKQAIYAFRGGDIATYLKAKHEISSHAQGAVFTMDTNWRSSPYMVKAVNALFSGLANPFRAKDIPFQEVNAAKSPHESLSSTALYITQLAATEINKEQMASALADHSVQQVRTLLDSFSDCESGQNFKNSDIAILVRSGAEGELIKQRLSNIGISASFEGKSSIFESSEAQAIYFLLHAVADPKNEFAVRRCLAEVLYGVDDKQYEKLNTEAKVLSQYLLIFEDLHKRWLSSGVLAMLREALRKLNVYEHWQAQSAEVNEWERSLSNINQLAELLQIQSRIYRGHFALIRWLRDSISSANAADDESKLRLESDEQLIRIVTIHKSKGLEYPFVFVPFLFSGRGADEAWFYSYKSSYNNPEKKAYLTLDLLKDEAHLEQADDERLAEDIRLLYVALTRAKYQCFIGTTAYKGQGKISLSLAKTAWAYLLFQGETPKPLNDEVLTDCLTRFQQRFDEVIELQQINIDDLNLQNSLSRSRGRANVEVSTSPSELQMQVLQKRIEHDWRVQSFTGLMHESHARQKKVQVQSLSPALSEAITIFGFPKGSRAGTFLHTLFESVSFESAELIDQLQSQYASVETFIEAKLSLSKLVEETLLPQWSTYLAAWMKAVLAFPMSDQIALADLKEQDYIAEMAFHFPVQQLQSHRFNLLLGRFNPQAGEIDFRTFEGHLKGAIDLVFKANGQYFILDYKSNYLGDAPEYYQEQALQQVIDEHRYDIQYLLYTLATHRFLKHRLGDAYNYERDFGGVYYLFLRGLALDSNDQRIRSGIVFIKPEFELIDALDREVSGS